MEEEKNNNNKRHTILLTVIGIATLLVAVVGATFAYFTATVSGNASNDNVQVQTATYGLEVAYQDSNNSINLTNQDLKQTEAETNYEETLGLSIHNTGTVSQTFNIDLSSVANTFCQKVNAQEDTTCSESGSMDVSKELYYKVNKCTDAEYTSCTTEITSETAAPTKDGSIASNITIASQATEYYQVVVGIKNENKLQNYNQGKSFSGKVVISAVVN